MADESEPLTGTRAGEEMGAEAEGQEMTEAERQRAVREFGDEFRRRFQEVLDREGAENVWKKIYERMRQEMGDGW
ncbi:MAG: hypothetical protein II152_06160 [Succinivibrionaceae bacterium]|nr:hypothetical protein [Succinivibrionaceae bacterium]